ncbi:hypothetical protein BX600DRAFT_132140 [Xylariales sp. PMI_506]|nr:hypothetical protein BX600DRAFT_132140 [Xylariales sp. PMI_506]
MPPRAVSQWFSASALLVLAGPHRIIGATLRRPTIEVFWVIPSRQMDPGARWYVAAYFTTGVSRSLKPYRYIQWRQVSTGLLPGPKSTTVCL